MKVEWNRKYTTIAIYAVCVILIGLLAAVFLFRFTEITHKLKEITAVLLPFTIAILVAVLLNPLLNLIEKKLLKNIAKRSTKRKLGILLTYILVLALVGWGVWYLIPRTLESIMSIYNAIPSYINDVGGLLTSIIEKLPGGMLPDEMADMLQEAAQSIYTWLRGILPTVMMGITRVTSGLLNFVVGIILSVYLLYEKELFFAQGKKIVYAFLPERTADVVVSTLRDGGQKIGGFISGKVLDSLIIGVMCFIGMIIMDIPYVVLVSVVVGVTNIIPYFGPFIGAIPSILFILTADPVKALWFAIFILALQQFDGNILGPRILGESTGLSAIWVIFAILFFGKHLGFVGMVFGVPLFAIIYALLKGLVQYCLWKKGKPLDTREYVSERHPLLK
ncbi:MAG: AI-2E family transporter [Oscillospiraceae bacterium]|nr:AI-2E family transporter [Oscillospiraceae bacterium]